MNNHLVVAICAAIFVCTGLFFGIFCLVLRSSNRELENYLYKSMRDEIKENFSKITSGLLTLNSISAKLKTELDELRENAAADFSKLCELGAASENRISFNSEEHAKFKTEIDGLSGVLNETVPQISDLQIRMDMLLEHLGVEFYTTKERPSIPSYLAIRKAKAKKEA